LNSTQIPRVLIVADDPLTRSGLAALLANQPGCIVSGQSPANADLNATLNVYDPDVVLWDVGWDASASLEHIADLRDTGTPIVALLPDEAHATETWIAGARGLLLRSASPDNLVAALNAVAQGLVVLDTTLGAVLLSTRDRVPAPSEELTARELQVLQALAEGLPNKAIALRLGISEHTIKFHVNSILSKLGAQSRTDAVVRASRLGLIIL
jgi:two-component system nitrate/nitrite response regulator NarL